MTLSPDRYSSITIILHWIMGLAFIAMLTSGLVMEYVDLDRAVKFPLYQLHKSVGVLLIAAFVLRLAARLFAPTPALPDTLPPLEKTLAKLGHFALYGLMIAMPMSGWIMSSTSSSGLPIMVFDLFEWPLIPDLSGNKEIGGLAREAHTILAFTLIGVLVAHVGAVIKHALVEKTNLLTRMWWS